MAPTTDSTDWPELPPVSHKLLCAQPAPRALFLDNNVVGHSAALTQAWREAGRTLLISSVVFSERLARFAGPKTLETQCALLDTLGIRIVPFDADSASMFWELTRELDFAPLQGQQESEKACRARLRADLMILAHAMRWKRPLITNNTRDFTLFGRDGLWQTADGFHADLAAQLTVKKAGKARDPSRKP